MEMVNHPKHYNELKLKGQPVETIDLIKTFTSMKGLNNYKSFLIGNIIKYLSRFPFKGSSKQDLEKAKWYLEKLILEYGDANGYQ